MKLLKSEEFAFKSCLTQLLSESQLCPKVFVVKGQNCDSNGEKVVPKIDSNGTKEPKSDTAPKNDSKGEFTAEKVHPKDSDTPKNAVDGENPSTVSVSFGCGPPTITTGGCSPPQHD